MALSISQKLVFVISAFVVSAMLGLFGSMQINKAATLHKLNYLHIEANAVLYSHLIENERVSVESDIFRSDIELIKEQPVACLAVLGALERSIMTFLGTERSIELCKEDIALANATLLQIDEYEKGNISKKSLDGLLLVACDQFQENSKEFQPLVATTVEFVVDLVFTILIGGSILLFIYAVMLTKGISKDYKRLVATEKALTSSEEHLRLIMDSVPVGIAYLDCDKKFQFHNQGYIDLIELYDTNLIGQTVQSIMGTDNYNKRKKEIAIALEGKAVKFENNATMKDGTIKIFSARYEPHIIQDGKVAGFFALIDDVTETRNLAITAERESSKLSEIFDIAPFALITLNKELKIQMFNQRASEIFGYDNDEIFGQHIDVFIPTKFHENHAKHISEFEKSKANRLLMDDRKYVFGLKKDGSEFPASIAVSKLVVEGEEIYTLMIQDITEKELARERLLRAKVEAENANRAKSQFLASVSHELRTPLNAILGFSQVMTDEVLGKLGNPKYVEYSKDILDSGTHLMDLIDDLIDISTIEMGKMTMQKRNLCIGETVRGCVKLLSEKAVQAGIIILTKIPEKLPVITADQRSVKQIVLNLLSNAIKFTPDGGKINIQVIATSRNIKIRIEDSGQGISPDKIEKLTEIFVRGEEDQFIAEKGWGLGLAITKSLVQLHNGNLDIKSELGKGTIVTVTIPFENDGETIL